MNSTSPRIHRFTAEPTIETPGTVVCPHCGGRVDLAAVVTVQLPAAVAVTTEPGSRTTVQVAAVRVVLAAELRRMLEVIGGRRPVGQLGDELDPAVLRYVRACRTGAGQAWALRSVRVCFPVEDAVEVAAGRRVDRPGPGDRRALRAPGRAVAMRRVPPSLILNVRPARRRWRRRAGPPPACRPQTTEGLWTTRPPDRTSARGCRDAGQADPPSAP